MNISDSERIKAILESCGYTSAPEKGADLIIVNACSVRQAAVDRIFGKLKRWQGKRVFITGCVLSADKSKLKNKVELIFDIKELQKLPQYLNCKSMSDKYKNYLQVGVFHDKKSTKKEAFVPIMTGCNNFCTYCAVPYTRGREISRPEKEIINEVKKLVCEKVKKILLLGQNVNNYGFDLKNSSFTKLLKKIIKIPGKFQISFMTSNPWNFSDELIELIAKEPKISKEIHLPMQSGDDEILCKMNRKYTVKQYLKLVNNLRYAISNLRLSTDIIVGFPTETKKAFENTIRLCKKAKFDKAYIGMYSPRPGTVSAKIYKDDVSRKEKKRRWKVLNDLIN